MTVLRNLTKMSYAKIGAIFNRDHATAISSKKAIENQREYQPYLSQLYKAIYSGKTQELKITHPKIYNEYIGSNGVVNPKQNTNHIVGVHTSRPAQLPPEKDWIHPKKSPFKKHPNNPIKEDFIFPIF
jgi:hypothetical protein